MDPGANLKEQIELANSLTNNEEMRTEDYHQNVARLAELVLALNKWLEAGGYLPYQWE